MQDSTGPRLTKILPRFRAFMSQANARDTRIDGVY